MKNFSFCIALIMVLWLVSYPCAASSNTVSITGLVKQPMNLSIDDLNGFDSIKVQLNEVMTDGSFRGVFLYRGVPLRALLELAYIEKEESAFGKKVDLAIRIKGENGKVVALSWGEVFYRNPGRIIIATSAQPIMPKHSCTGCHSPEEYQPRMDKLKRNIDFPKLVISSDTFADRSLDGVTSIEVIDLRPKMPSEKSEKFYSKDFSIIGANINNKDFKTLSGFPRTKMTIKHLGEGKGFHGIDRFEGVFFKSLLDTVELKPDLAQVFLASAPDGYRSLFSYGEIYLDTTGDRLLIADRLGGKDIENGGKFVLVPPDDLMSDRDVKALQKIEVLSLKRPAKIYIIGVGCGDTNLITLNAISSMAEADAFVVCDDILKRFGKYMGKKPVLFDHYKSSPPKVRKENPGMSEPQIEAKLAEKRKEYAVIIQNALDSNKTVAIMDYGDPTIWSGWSWLRQYFPQDQIEVIPGLSSFNVSNSMIRRRIGCNGSIVLTTPMGIQENPEMIKNIADKGETLAIFMGLKEVPALAAKFKKDFKTDTPAYLVYKAGYSGSEHVIQTDLNGLADAAGKYHEKFLGLIYVGRCLSELEGACYEKKSHN
ncbi:MAG: hypothetical protein KKC46_08885 [Proteobacteria bacterium]|nr:hypothetical protein [Pseudomonadota bacterium]